MSRRLTAAIGIGYVLDALIVAAGDGLAPLPLLGFAACLLVVLAVQRVCSRPGSAAWSARRRGVLLATQALAVAVPLAWAGPVGGVPFGFLAASALLLLSGRARWVALAGVSLGALVALTRAGLGGVDVAYGVYFTLLTGLMFYGTASLAALARDLEAARGDVVRMAMVAERQRLARDMHDLLGFNLSALLLKSELAYRLLTAAPHLVAAEVADVVTLSRQALDDVHGLTDGCSTIALATEAESARSLLAAAGVRVRLDLDGAPLPAAVDAVLAVVLREAATNILRHSRAAHAVVELRRLPGQVVLRVGNDGADPCGGEADRTEGCGLGNLARRLGSIGGDLEVAADQPWFRLTARAPVDEAAVATQAARAAHRADAAPGAAATGDPAPGAGPAPGHLRAVRMIVQAVLGGYGLLLLVNAVPVARSPGAVTAVSIGAVAAAGTQVLYTRCGSRTAARPGWWWLLPAGQAVAVAVPFAVLGRPWGSMGGFLAGSVLLVVRGRVRWAGYLAIGAAVLVAGIAASDSPAYIAYLVLSTGLTGLVVYGVSLLSATVVHVEQVRHELARLAVEADRLRTAQELNDVLGRNLLAVNARVEVIHNLVATGSTAVEQQLADVVKLARSTVEHVRAVAGTYRSVTFAREVEAVLLALEVAGITADVPALPAVPPGVDALLALALRQFAAEVLEHPGVTRCRIRVDVRPQSVRLRVADDGPPQRAARGRRGADGAHARWEAPRPVSGRRADLCDRLRAVDGRVTAGTAGGWQESAVEMPLEGHVERTSPL